MVLHLKFKKRSFEKEFLKHYDEQAIPAMRFGFWVAFILYGLFSILDYYLMPLSYTKIWFIRFGIVIPSATVVYILSYVRSFRPYMQGALALGSVVMGVGIVAMMAIADSSELGYRYYYAGMMLVIMGICSLFRLRFYYALSATLVILIAYEYNAVVIQGMISGGIDTVNTRIFINNNFFFVSSNLIGLMAAYYVEIFSRTEFIQQEEIADRHGDIVQLLDKMKRDLELARQIQARLLPESSPVYPGVRLSVLYKPMEELGGDFYDFIKFQEHNLFGIFISDVSGHGLPAALITTMLKALNSTSGNIKFSSSGFLNYINTHLTGQIGDNFLTAIYAIYDTDTRILKYARAGHPYPVLIRNGTVSELLSGGGAIGIDSYMKYDEVSMLLEPGDKILFYTDGLTEETDSSREMFMDTYFQKVLPALSSMRIDDVVSISYRRLIEYSGSDKFEDDVCILGLEVF